MAKVIEVFVKNMEVPVATEHGYVLMVPGHECTRKPVVRAVMEKVLPEADKNALNLSLAIAEEKGLKVKVNNISTWRGKLKAQLKGVKKTPTVIIENHRIEGAIAKDKLLSML